MSALSREPENLPERLARAEHHEAEIQKRKAAQAAGAAEWVAKHSRGTTLQVDRSNPRTKTVSEYPVV